jgi:23S rRNA (cytidine1920-2'-O)/16S rRNA (cytidine1409-2'-O)-methyltransferase
MAGKVIVDDQRIDKAGQGVPETAVIRLKGLSKYVGKGGFKLEGALSDFSVDVSGKVALDAGAATGGFTDCLLQHGASRVYAVDVGFGSLVGTLRNDKRVVNLEKTNISDIDPGQLTPQPALGTVDLSYLSLKKGIPIFSALLEPDGELVCLVKPLFEISDSKARRTGKIEEPSHYSDLLQDLLDFVGSIGLHTCGLSPSHIPGGKGTLEFFLHLSKERSLPSPDLDIEGVVAAALGFAQK